MKYDIEICDDKVCLIRYKKVLAEDEEGNLIEEEEPQVVMETPKEKYLEMFGEYCPKPQINAKYFGNLKNAKLVTGKKMRKAVITPLKVCRTEFLKPLEDEGITSHYLDVFGIPIQRAIVCGFVNDIKVVDTKDGEKMTILTIFDGTAFRRLSGYKIVLSPEEYKGMFVRAFVKIGQGEFIRDGEERKIIRLNFTQPPIIVQPKEYILHKKFIDEQWSKILKKIDELTVADMEDEKIKEEIAKEVEGINEEEIEKDECELVITPKTKQIFEVIKGSLEIYGEASLNEICDICGCEVDDETLKTIIKMLNEEFGEKDMKVEYDSIGRCFLLLKKGEELQNTTEIETE